MDGVRGAFARVGLVRPRTGRLVAGVCAGVAQATGVPAWLVRVALLLLLVLPGSPFVIYAVLWLCMPDSAWVPPVRSVG